MENVRRRAGTLFFRKGAASPLACLFVWESPHERAGTLFFERVPLCPWHPHLHGNLHMNKPRGTQPERAARSRGRKICEEHSRKSCGAKPEEPRGVQPDRIARSPSFDTVVLLLRGLRRTHAHARMRTGPRPWPSTPMPLEVDCAEAVLGLCLSCFSVLWRTCARKRADTRTHVCLSTLTAEHADGGGGRLRPRQR